MKFDIAVLDLLFTVADGLALGAAAGLSKTDVELIIFLAIMLHKAPAAFGFTSFLIHEVREICKDKKNVNWRRYVFIVSFTRAMIKQQQKSICCYLHSQLLALLFSHTLDLSG